MSALFKRLSIALLVFALSRGILLSLSANGIHPELRVAHALGLMLGPLVIPAIPWQLSGLIGLLGLFFAPHLFDFAARFWPQNWRRQSKQYLPDRDSELTLAVQLMVQNSAWGKWYTSQTPQGEVDSFQSQSTLNTAAHLVTEAAMNGRLTIRGRDKDEVNYKDVPAECGGWLRLTWRRTCTPSGRSFQSRAIT